MLADRAGTRGAEILDPGGRRDTVPAVGAVVAVGCFDTAGDAVSRGMVILDADGRKDTVLGVVLVGIERECATAATGGGCGIGRDKDTAGLICGPRCGMRVRLIACWTAV